MFLDVFFRQRLELMREMYHNEADFSPSSPDTHVEPLTGGDPFYDRFPWFRLVGRYVKILYSVLSPASYFVTSYRCFSGVMCICRTYFTLFLSSTAFQSSVRRVTSWVTLPLPFKLFPMVSVRTIFKYSSPVLKCLQDVTS